MEGSLGGARPYLPRSLARGPRRSARSHPASQILVATLRIRSFQPITAIVPQRSTQHCGGLHLRKVPKFHETSGYSVWIRRRNGGAPATGGRSGGHAKGLDKRGSGPNEENSATASWNAQKASAVLLTARSPFTLYRLRISSPALPLQIAPPALACRR